MKKSILILIVVVMASMGCIAVPVLPDVADPETLIIQNIIETPGINKNQIYDGIRLWLAENFRSSRTVIDYENRERGSLIIKGLLPYPCEEKGSFKCSIMSTWKVRFTMKIEVKDDKFRIIFDNLMTYRRPSYTVPLPGDFPFRFKNEIEAITPALVDIIDRITLSVKNNKQMENW